MESTVVYAKNSTSKNPVNFTNLLGTEHVNNQRESSVSKPQMKSYTVLNLPSLGRFLRRFLEHGDLCKERKVNSIKTLKPPK